MSLAERCGAHSPAREAACASVLQQVRDAGLQQVRVAWADLQGQHRCKTLPVADAAGQAALAAALQGGIGMVSTLLLKDSSDRTALPVFEAGALAAVPGLAGYGAANNVLLLPVPESFTVLPWAPQVGWLRAEPWWPDGRHVAADPRRVLQQALAELAAFEGAGLTLRCGLELEFHVHRITDDGLAAEGPAAGAWPAEAPALRHTHPGWQLLSEAHTDACDDILQTVQRTALGLGLPLRSLEIEMGPSQFEAVFAPTDALTAADQALAFRNGLRQALRRAGYHASFACKPPLAGSVGSGWHLHQSLVDAQGRNAFMPQAAGRGERPAHDAQRWLSPTGANWLAGLLAHARGLTALCAPSIPAYARYQGGVMAPRAAVWGRDNRGAMLRVVGHDAADQADTATRIENRLAEPLANPYLMLAGQMFAGLHGLRAALPAAAGTETPYDPAHPALPATLDEALTALAADPVLMQGLGAPMAAVYTAVRRQELARHAAATDKTGWERREYFARS
jgi:glutamine synthetase